MMVTVSVGLHIRTAIDTVTPILPLVMVWLDFCTRTGIWSTELFSHACDLCVRECQ